MYLCFVKSIHKVRMLDGTITDAVEARSLSLNPQVFLCKTTNSLSSEWKPLFYPKKGILLNNI